MEAPDKIYIGILPSKVGEGLVYTTVSKEHPYAKEYFRKDALLKWLEEFKAQSLELREAGYGDVFYGAQIAILEETINKIKSL